MSDTVDDILLDKHIHISPQPVHPDLDILPPGKFTIQIGTRESFDPTHEPHELPHGALRNSPYNSLLTDRSNTAFVYRPDGTLVGSLPKHRLQWLRNRYDHFKISSPDEFSKLTIGRTFEQHIAELLCRYQTRDKCHDPDKTSRHWPLPTDLERKLHNSLTLDTYHFVSPLTVPISPSSSPTYSSEFHTDCLFGATTSTWTSAWTGNSFAIPPFTKQHIAKSIRWAIASALHTPTPCATTLLVPTSKSSGYRAWLNHPLVTHTQLLAPGNPLFTPTPRPPPP